MIRYKIMFGWSEAQDAGGEKCTRKAVLYGVIQPFTVHGIMQHLGRIFVASGLFCHGCICSVQQPNGGTGGPHMVIQDEPMHARFGPSNQTLPNNTKDEN
jgi:hypothetical protein